MVSVSGGVGDVKNDDVWMVICEVDGMCGCAKMYVGVCGW